jgi:hypothetical protein
VASCHSRSVSALTPPRQGAAILLDNTDTTADACVIKQRLV